MLLPLTLNLDVIMHFIDYLQPTKESVLNAAMGKMNHHESFSPVEGLLLREAILQRTSVQKEHWISMPEFNRTLQTQYKQRELRKPRR